MADVPTVRSGAVCLFPLTTGKRFRTSIQTFCDDTEQRFGVTTGLNRFVLTYSKISGYDKANLEEWFVSAKGEYDQSLSITVNSVTYGNLMLESDTLDVSQDGFDSFSLSMTLVQWR
jgi:hypothetical protein